MKRLNIFTKILLVGLFMTFFNQSCVNLDEEIYSEVTLDQFYEDADQFISALGSAYVGMYGYADGGPLSLQEVTSDEVVVPTRGPDWDDGGHWRRLQLHSWNYEDPELGGVWGFAYGGVSTCNRLVYTFEGLVEEGRVEADFAAPFIAELKVLRGFYYWTLLDVYGNVPIVSRFDDEDDTPPTKSRQEVYDFIVESLEEFVPLLAENVDLSTYGRMSKWAGKALLAKIYLNAEVYTGDAEWEKAKAACDDIINSGKFNLEANYFSNFDADIKGSSEFIFAIPYDKVYARGFQLVMRTLHYGMQNTYNLTAQPWNGFCTMEEFYNSYDDEDLRKGKPGTLDEPYLGRGNFLVGYQYQSNGELVTDDGFEAGDPDGAPLNLMPKVNELGPVALKQAGARIGKWEYEMGGTDQMSNDYGVFRYADILLMKAEALWRISGDATDAEALALVNQVRVTHGGGAIGLIDNLDGPVSFAIEDGSIPGGELLNERGREMAFENFRRQDLIRWGLFLDVEKFTPPVNNPGDRFETGEHTNIFPIPRTQLDANGDLIQNPGYQGGGG
jgi:hypothetical protein